MIKNRALDQIENNIRLQIGTVPRETPAKPAMRIWMWMWLGRKLTGYWTYS